jgi:hypothetical protein
MAQQEPIRKYNIGQVILRMRKEAADLDLEFKKGLSNLKRQEAKEARLKNGPAGKTVPSKPRGSQLRAHDRFGNPSPELEGSRLTNYQPSRQQSRSSGFSLSSKMDLARPLNFNPGPGHYFRDR